MAQTDAQRAVLQAVHGDGALTPYGDAKAQMQDTTAYIAVPQQLTQLYGISQGDPFSRAYHAETGCLIVCLRDDVDLFR